MLNPAFFAGCKYNNSFLFSKNLITLVSHFLAIAQILSLNI